MSSYYNRFIPGKITSILMGRQKAGWTAKLVWTPCDMHLFVIHITPLPVLQIILSQITGYLINGDL